MSIRSNVDRGEFDQRVRIERNTPTYDANNYPTDSWAPVKTCWARVDAAKVSNSNREPEHAGAIQSIGDYVVWVRADIVSRFSVTVKDRVIWRGKVLNIQDIPDQQLRGRKTALLCQEGQNSG